MDGLFPPCDFSLENYADVLGPSGIGDAFINSLFITIPATIIPILVAAFAAYAFSWMNFPGRNILFVVGRRAAGRAAPDDAHPDPPAVRRSSASPASSWRSGSPTPGYGLPFAIYLLRNFMGALPREVFESAYIDGASPVTAFFRLALPMSVPAIAALAIFQFLFVWNDLLVVARSTSARPSPENLPMTVAVANLVNSLGGGWHLLGAAAFLSMALPLVVFFALQRYFVRGITGGAVKG